MERSSSPRRVPAVTMKKSWPTWSLRVGSISHLGSPSWKTRVPAGKDRGTATWEKRGLADAIPIWDASLCIDCGKCAIVCPHAAIRMKAFPESALDGAPESFTSKAYGGRDWLVRSSF